MNVATAPKVETESQVRIVKFSPVTLPFNQSSDLCSGEFLWMNSFAIQAAFEFKFADPCTRGFMTVLVVDALDGLYGNDYNWTDSIMITFRWVDRSNHTMKKSGACLLRQWWKQTQFYFLKRSSYNHMYSTKSTTKRTVWDSVAFNQSQKQKIIVHVCLVNGLYHQDQASDKQTLARRRLIFS